MIILLYSKYSNFSKYFISTMNQSNIMNKLPIKFLCVDNEKLRKRILTSKQIKIHNIPCILVVQKNGVVDKYEGTDCFLWLEDMVQKLIPKVPIEQPPKQEEEEENLPVPPQPKPRSNTTSVDDIETDDDEHKIDRNYDQKSNRKSDVKKNHLSKFVEEMQKSREIEEKNLPRPPIDSPRM